MAKEVKTIETKPSNDPGFTFGGMSQFTFDSPTKTHASGKSIAVLAKQPPPPLSTPPLVFQFGTKTTTANATTATISSFTANASTIASSTTIATPAPSSTAPVPTFSLSPKNTTTTTASFSTTPPDDKWPQFKSDFSNVGGFVDSPPRSITQVSDLIGTSVRVLVSVVHLVGRDCPLLEVEFNGVIDDSAETFAVRCFISY
jgi:hypothetical protein